MILSYKNSSLVYSSYQCVLYVLVLHDPIMYSLQLSISENKLYTVVTDSMNEYTHGDRRKTIPFIAYYINQLNSQRYGRGRDGPTYF